MTNLSKTEYLVKSLSKIRHKEWELYTISRIIHLLDDYDIELICQQMIRKADGKRYLVDLFFPQFNLFLEINEKQHLKDLHKSRDVVRQKEILDIAGLTQIIISIFDPVTKLHKDIKTINREIIEFVELIKNLKSQQISEGSFSAWDIEKEEQIKKIISSGVLSTQNAVPVRRQIDALRFFGASFKGYQKATWNIPGTNLIVWFPKLYPRKDWNNEVSPDGLNIFEQKVDGSALEFQNFKEIRVVFPHYRDHLGRSFYKFIGIYETDQSKSNDFLHVHKKVGSRIELNSFKY